MHWRLDIHKILFAQSMGFKFNSASFRISMFPMSWFKLGLRKAVDEQAHNIGSTNYPEWHHHFPFIAFSYFSKINKQHKAISDKRTTEF